ncbi:MAG TPA: sulfur carrier protein ThiS [Hyphomicrobiaceae bacterium]|nr:sulfur carrier protein ThiS [Hyphomicrobiaceae bacterium]
MQEKTTRSPPAAPATLAIFVNGEPTASHAGTLAELVASLGHGGARVATALNGDFVPEKRRPDTRLSPGDRVEIVSPRQGG